MFIFLLQTSVDDQILYSQREAENNEKWGCKITTHFAKKYCSFIPDNSTQATTSITSILNTCITRCVCDIESFECEECMPAKIQLKNSKNGYDRLTLTTSKWPFYKKRIMMLRHSHVKSQGLIFRRTIRVSKIESKHVYGRHCHLLLHSQSYCTVHVHISHLYCRIPTF